MAGVVVPWFVFVAALWSTGAGAACEYLETELELEVAEGPPGSLRRLREGPAPSDVGESPPVTCGDGSLEGEARPAPVALPVPVLALGGQAEEGLRRPARGAGVHVGLGGVERSQGPRALGAEHLSAVILDEGLQAHDGLGPAARCDVVGGLVGEGAGGLGVVELEGARPEVLVGLVLQGRGRSGAPREAQRGRRREQQVPARAAGDTR